MEIGVVLPQIEIGDDPAVLCDYALAAEELGYEHVLAYDHVLGVHPDREGWDGPYDYEDTFHEPLTLFSYFAGITDRIALVSGIVILPQRQTALVAKQAAEVDVLSEGRLRLGVGLGWNEPEYVALGEDFSTRGKRIGEQVEVLRALWTDELVEYDGDYHTIPNAGINPLPVQRPVPVWMGATADRALRRTARLADGWFPMTQPGEKVDDRLARIEEYADEAGRDPDEIGIHGRVYAVPGEEDEWIERASAWADLGADYLGINTMYQGLAPAEHVEHVREVAGVLEDAGLL